jgi:hypothetical protein
MLKLKNPLKDKNGFLYVAIQHHTMVFLVIVKATLGGVKMNQIGLP